VLQVADGRVEVFYEGGPRWVVADGFPDLAVGEYVTVYAGTVLEQMPAAVAEDILRFYAEWVEMVDAAHG